MPARALAALTKDPRIEVFTVDDITPDQLSFAERLAGVVVATDGDPLDALAYAVTAGLRGPFIVALTRRQRSEQPSLLEAGALGFLTLPVTTAGVTRLLPTLRKTPALAHIDRSLRLVLDPIGRVARYRDRSVRLSQREFAVLHCLSARRGRPVGAEELLTMVWGTTGARPRQIVDVYVHQLRRKLERLGLQNAISTIRRFGYALGLSESEPRHATAVRLP